MSPAEMIIELLSVMHEAVKRGDWVVDGSYDPEMVFDRAEWYLRSIGYEQNSIDDSWMRGI